jgi:hypothetical protein
MSVGSGESAETRATEWSVLYWVWMMRQIKGVAMNIGGRVVGGFLSALCLGMLLGAMIIPAQAGDRSVLLIDGKNFPSGSAPPGVPQAGRRFYSPPVFIDRSPPISERPFAKPFIDRGPSVSERPLAPIGGGAQVPPGSVPFVWCQGQWVRVDNPWQSCPSR